MWDREQPLLMTVAEVTDILRTTPKAIYMMAARQQLPGVVRSGRRRAYPPGRSSGAVHLGVGRDLDGSERQLAYDEVRRRLGGEAEKCEAVDMVPAVLADAGIPLPNRQVEDAASHAGGTRSQVRSAPQLGVRQGEVLMEPGSRRDNLYRWRANDTEAAEPPGEATGRLVDSAALLPRLLPLRRRA